LSVARIDGEAPPLLLPRGRESAGFAVSSTPEKLTTVWRAVGGHKPQ
jgi:hypothetical protein